MHRAACLYNIFRHIVHNGNIHIIGYSRRNRPPLIIVKHTLTTSNYSAAHPVVDTFCHWKEIFFSREGEESSFASEGEDTT